MLFSPSRKLLFIKSNKTASTSIEIALSRLFIAESDLIFTPLDFKDECLRIYLSQSPYRFNCIPSIPFFSLKRITVSLKLLKYKYKRFLDQPAPLQNNYDHLCRIHQLYYKRYILATGFQPHITYSASVLQKRIFTDYYSFSFARHPFKRFYSFLLYRAKCLSPNESLNWSSSDWLVFANSIFPDFQQRSIKNFVFDPISSSFVSTVYTFEHMKSSLCDLSLRLSFAKHTIYDLLPMTKSSTNFSKVGSVDLDTILSPDIRSLILRSEEWTFDTFGYKESVDDFSPNRVFWDS